VAAPARTGAAQLPALPERSLPRLVGKLWRDWSPGYDATTDLAHVRTSLAGRAHRSAALGYYRAAARPFRVPHRYRRWQAAMTDPPTRPLMYLHGRDDGCLGLAVVRRTGETLPPGSEMHVVDDAGHFLNVEQPAIVNRLVRDFLSR